MRTFLVCIAAFYILVSCSSPKEEIPPVTVMQPTSGKIVIYQMMTRLFGNKQSLNKSYGTIAENGVGKFKDIDDTALKALKQLGISHVWYTGVLEHAVLTDYTAFGIPLDDADVVKGRAGSPYAIKDYYDVNPDLATDVKARMKEFEALISRTHANSLGVVIDFVPNHVARAYHSDARPEGVRDLGETDDKTVSFSARNNFYYLPGESFKVPTGYVSLGPDNSFPTKDGVFAEIPAKVTGNDQFTSSPGINEWFETVKLNYGVDIRDGRKTYFDPIPDTWNKMRDILVFWAKKDVDGFRCDMAEMVPVEFWNWVIPQVKEVKPGIIFIAEIYNPAQYANYIHTGGFDYLYDKVQLYDSLRLMINGHRSTRDIAAIRESQSGINDHMLHFLENHDEQRIASQQFAGNPFRALSAMVVSATLDRGPVMIYFGQEVGEPGKGAEGFQQEDGRTTIFDYWGVPEHQKWMNQGKFDGDTLSAEQKVLRQFYESLLNLSGKNQALAFGDFADLTAANLAAGNFHEDVAAYVRFQGDEKLLIVAGFNAKATDIKVQIPAAVVTSLGLTEGSHTAEDLLRKTTTVTFDKAFVFPLHLEPYGCFVFKIR